MAAERAAVRAKAAGRRIVVGRLPRLCCVATQFEQAGDPPQGGTGGAVERLCRGGDSGGHRQPGFETDRKLGPRRGQLDGIVGVRRPCGDPAKDQRKPEPDARCQYTCRHGSGECPDQQAQADSTGHPMDRPDRRDASARPARPGTAKGNDGAGEQVVQAS